MSGSKEVFFAEPDGGNMASTTINIGSCRRAEISERRIMRNHPEPGQDDMGLTKPESHEK